MKRQKVPIESLDRDDGCRGTTLITRQTSSHFIPVTGDRSIVESSQTVIRFIFWACSQHHTLSEPGKMSLLRFGHHFYCYTVMLLCTFAFKH